MSSISVSDPIRQLTACSTALETAHAVWATVQLAKTMSPDENIVMCLSGRGDKDVSELSELLAANSKWSSKLDWHIVR